MKNEVGWICLFHGDTVNGHELFILVLFAMHVVKMSDCVVKNGARNM